MPEAETSVEIDSMPEHTREPEPGLPLTRGDPPGTRRFRLLLWMLGLMMTVAGGSWFWQNEDLSRTLFRRGKSLVLRSSLGSHSPRTVPPLTNAPAPATSAPLNLPLEAALDSVRLSSKRDFTAVELQLNRPVEVHAVRLGNPDRVYFDLANTHLGAGLNPSPDTSQVLEVNDGFIRRIRVAQKEPTVARIVLDLKCACEFSYVMSPHPPYRLMIDVQPPM